MELNLKLVLGALLLCGIRVSMSQAVLDEHFYNSICPGGTIAVQNKVISKVHADKSLAAALLRLHFHDCFVRGCDSSVLIVNSNGQSERDALPNANSLRGFEVIDSAKAAVEAICPGKFSCADIVAQAARDAVIAIGGPFWAVEYGRRDGNESSASEANSDIPSPFSDYPTLVNNFAAKGLTAAQMVTLSGAHTIGSGRCAIIQRRLYNFTGVGDTDPSLDPTYATFLKSKCVQGDVVTRQALDSNNGTFDNRYFKDVLANKGFFTSDATLITTSQGIAFVNEEADHNVQFFIDFKDAMRAMGRVGVITGSSGRVRTNCNDPNS